MLARDARADGRFVYAVRTTGVWCHPSSPTRRPRPGNVEFFDTPAAAEAAGYRPSRRAAPAGEHAARIAAACHRIEACVQAGEPAPALDELAHASGLSPFHFHRLFKAATGLTPAAWARARRADALRQALPRSARVTDAVYDAGFGAPSRFYAQADAALGMAPGAFRAGDLEVADDGLEHTPRTLGGEPCLCLAATDAPLRFRSILPRLLQPIFRIWKNRHGFFYQLVVAKRTKSIV